MPQLSRHSIASGISAADWIDSTVRSANHRVQSDGITQVEDMLFELGLQVSDTCAELFHGDLIALYEQCHVLYEHTDQMVLLAHVNRYYGATSGDDSSFPSKGEAVVTLIEKMYADRRMSGLEDILNDNH